MSCNTGAMYEYTTSKRNKNLAPNQNRYFLGAMKIKIEIETEIASFCQDCRKYQDCLSLGNLSKYLIGTFSGGNLHHWFLGCCNAVVVRATSDPGSHGKPVYVSLHNNYVLPAASQIRGHMVSAFLFPPPSPVPPVTDRDKPQKSNIICHCPVI